MDLKSAKTKLRKVIDTVDASSDVVIQLTERPIIIYGAGNYGQIIYRLLTKNGIPANCILGFLDVAASDDSMLFGLPVYRPDDLKGKYNLWKEAEVIISIYCSLEQQSTIRSRLIELGYQNVRSCYEIAISFYNANDPFSRISEKDFLNSKFNDIIDGCRFWNDEKSLQTYVNHFIGYANHDINHFLLERDHKQYFPSILLQRKRYDRFIDCGAFNGDTICDLIDIVGKIESLVLFEPCMQNFEKLSKYISSNLDRIADCIILYPCGVWDKTEQVQFNADAASASAISKDGGSFIQCVAIDDVLHGFAPTFIKMDIEGAEPKAIKGAEMAIKNYKPDLAISVYHSLTHFWEIPELISKWVPEYRFYLRTYGASGFETVMYATAGFDEVR